MDKVKITQKEFDEMYEIETVKELNEKITEIESVDGNFDMEIEEVISEAERKQEKSFRDA